MHSKWCIQFELHLSEVLQADCCCSLCVSLREKNSFCWMLFETKLEYNNKAKKLEYSLLSFSLFTILNNSLQLILIRPTSENLLCLQFQTEQQFIFDFFSFYSRQKFQFYANGFNEKKFSFVTFSLGFLFSGINGK